MDWTNEFVKESLPTPWSRRVATTTLTIALLLLFLPEWSPKIGLPQIGTETLLPRLLAVATILFLGSLVTLALIVRAYRELLKCADAKTQNISSRKYHAEPFDSPREKILLFVAENKTSTKSQIADALNINPEVAVFHLNKLLENDFVKSPSSSIEAWSVTQDGVAYLIRWGLLSNP